MSAFKHLKIAGKISMLVGVFLLIQLITTGFGILKMGEIGDELEEIVHQDLPISKVLTDITIHQLGQAHIFDQAVALGEIIKTDKHAYDTFKTIKTKFYTMSEGILSEIELGKRLIRNQERKSSSQLDSSELWEALSDFEKIERENLDYQTVCKEILEKIAFSKIEDVKEQLKYVERKENSLNLALESLLNKTENFTQKSAEKASEHEIEALKGMWMLTLFGALISLVLAFLFVRLLSRPLMHLSQTMEEVVAGDYSKRVEVVGQDEVGVLANSFNQMIENIQTMMLNISNQNWLQSNLSQVSELVQKSKDPKDLSQTLISRLATLMESGHGAVYVKNETSKRYELLASYGFVERSNMNNNYGEGERLVGQCVRENQAIVLSHVPDDYVHIGSGLGESKPKQIMVIPVSFKGEVLAVVELASFQPFSPIQRQLLQELISIIGLGLENQRQSQQTQLLLAETQAQAEEMQAQQEELRVQQEELTSTNEELRNQTEILQKNQTELEESRQEIEEKAFHVEQASRYKSEFLANMSHELRTPLNSMLILSKIFSENDGGNLTEKQMEAGGVIYNSGKDLLGLINNILDLAKVESGKQMLNLTPVLVETLAKRVSQNFNHMAEEKGLLFQVDVDKNIIQNLITDEDKVWQIVQNFISNALKFTKKGHVSVSFSKPSLSGMGLAISISDSGIGIAKDNLSMIFEAFQQADGSTNRKYGGTGLGLSICRELAVLLKGEIRLQSQEGIGSTFILELPETLEISNEQTVNHLDVMHSVVNDPQESERFKETETVENSYDPRFVLTGKTVLVVDDNMRNLYAMTAALEGKDMKVIQAGNGEVALQQLEKHPSIGLVLMDIMMPIMDGIETIQAIKKQERYQDIPIIALTAKAMIKDRERCLKVGACDFISKPVEIDRLLSLMRVWLNK